MADAITVQQMQDASADCKTLSDVMSGAPDTQIRSRLGQMIWTLATINSKIESVRVASDNAKTTIAGYVTSVEQTKTQAQTDINNKVAAVYGGYFAAFDTLANLNASTGAKTGQVAKVMNDPIASNNGDYRYTGSAWVKSADSIALTDAKNYYDIYANIPLSDFVAGSDSLGLPVTTDTFYKTPAYNYVPNSTITLSRSSSTSMRFGYQFSDDGVAFNEPIVEFAQTATISHATAKYVRFYIRHRTTGTSITQTDVNNSNIAITLYNYKPNSNRLALYRQVKTFDLFKITAMDFELGDDDATGAIASTNRVKTKPYYLKNGGTVTFNGSMTGFSYQIAVSDNPNTGFGTKQNFTSGAFTITADKPYFKLYATAGTFNYDNFKALSTFYFTTSADLSRYQFDLVDKIGREDFYNLNEFKKFKVTESDFVQGLYSLGSLFKSDGVLQTKAFKVKAGDVITISCPATTPQFWWNFGTGSTRVLTNENKVGTPTANWYNNTSYTITVPSGANYIAFAVKKQDGSIITPSELALFKFTAILNKTVADEKVDANTVTAFAPKKYFELTQADFLLGEEDNIAYMTSTYARSKLTYKLPIGAVVKMQISTTSTNLIFGATQGDSYYSVARAASGSTELYQTVTKPVLTSSPDKQYFKFYIRTKDGNLMTVEQFKALQFTISIEMIDDVAYQSDLTQLVYQQNQNRRNVSRFLESSASSFRTPSQAVGGVISFIDDDFRVQSYTELYSVVKANAIPYGFAVIPSYVGKTISTDTYGTVDQLFEMTADYNVEIMSHTWSHQGMSDTDAKTQHYQLQRAKEWFIAQGIYVKSFVYPYGHDSDLTHGIVNQYYESAYDFGANVIVNFDNIQNYTIQRYTFNWDSDMSQLKAAIDQAHATNGWIIFTTHAGLGGYWYDSKTNAPSPQPAMLVELVNYAKSVGCKLMKPSDAFQIYGNIAESDSGFKITAQGKIVGTTIA